MRRFVSRAGEKLEHALSAFALDVRDSVCADFGANAGGFTDCLLQRGAAKIYAIDTGYGALDWKLRRDSRVIVMERTNAMHLELDEEVDVVTIDVAWTKQRHILPAAWRAIKPTGHVICLIKPHYEASPKLLVKGVLPAEQVDPVVQSVLGDITAAGFEVLKTTPSPMLGSKGNLEVLAIVRPRLPNEQQPVPAFPPAL
jgi:23S rRNA (cytidine1920-2'-O)/16S rRNA (cytidine1409-2'-O)-methyltransferase